MQKEIMANGSVNLHPGFLFSPTDEELVFHFLCSKATLLPCHPNIIPELDLSLLDPWELNGKALSGGNDYYFFIKVKEHRATENGYWREIGVTNPIFSAVDKKVGIKKHLVFHVGEAPQGSKLEQLGFMTIDEYMKRTSLKTAIDMTMTVDRSFHGWTKFICR